MATPYIPGRIDFSLKAVHIPTINQSGEGVYVTGPHAGKSVSEIDPWVKVGTTTIDGTITDVVALFNGGVEHDEPTFVGGQWLRIKSFVTPLPTIAVIHCDIVRRQSEIDAETQRTCINCEEGPAELMFCRECSDRFRAIDKAQEPPCPECGPHGNRGEVLLASSWAKCTTCAGGKPGDLWGEVKVHEPAASHGALSSAIILKGASSEVAQAGVRQFIDALNKPPMSFMDARREALAAQHGQGFKVPTFAERAAELDNLRRYLESNVVQYDDDTIAKAAKIMESDIAFIRRGPESDDEFRQRIRSRFGVG